MPVYPTIRRTELDEPIEADTPPSYQEGVSSRRTTPRRGQPRTGFQTTVGVKYLIPLLLLFNLITMAMTLSAVFYLVGKAVGRVDSC